MFEREPEKPHFARIAVIMLGVLMLRPKGITGNRELALPPRSGGAGDAESR